MRVLPDEIGNLSAAEKVELLDAIWENLESSGLPLSEEQATELDRRVAAYNQNPAAVVPWEQVKTEINR